MTGWPPAFSWYWYTPPDGSSTTNRRSVMRTGLVSRSTGTSQGSVGQGGVASGVGAGGVGVATATGVGVAAGAGAVGAPLPPLPQDTKAAPRPPITARRRSFILSLPDARSLSTEVERDEVGARAVL